MVFFVASSLLAPYSVRTTTAEDFVSCALSNNLPARTRLGISSNHSQVVPTILSSSELEPRYDSFRISLAGAAFVRDFAFPIGYLAFGVPMPLSLTNHLTLPLRRAAAALAAGAIRGLGVPVLREGNILHLANGSLGVEDVCSGLRSLWVLVAGAAALAYWLRRGLGHGVLLCVAAVPVRLVSNEEE